MSPSPRTGRRILVVEDDHHLRRGMALALGAEGYEVQQAPDGEAGLRSLEGEAFDAVLLDTMMPRMDGLTMLRRLGERHRTIPPVILVSAAYALPGAEELRALGIRGVVPKPFAFDRLLSTLQEILERASDSEPSV